MIILCCPTYKRFDLCVQMIESAMRGSSQPDHILILDNSAGKFKSYLQDNEVTLSKNVSVVEAPYNMGVARGWNALLKIVENTWPDALAVVVNDDLALDEHALERIINVAQTDYINNAAYALVYCAGGIDAPNAFSFYMVHPKTFFTTVGPFDETIWPAYYDDNDMHYRMKLLGYDLTRVEGVTATHNEGGSATLKAFTAEERAEHDHRFNRNGEYYVRKWGGLPGQETYTIPFDGQDIMRHMIELHKNYNF